MIHKFQIPVGQIGLLSESTVLELFKDGRIASPFLERLVELWFDNLKFVDKKGYDHICLQSGQKYDLKCFTKRGMSFALSQMLGAGRKVDKDVLKEHAETMIYICCDINDFPNIRIRFADGKELIQKYPNGKIPFSHREKFFEETPCMESGVRNLTSG